MVSNKIEQRKLNENLLSGEKPHIYVEIRRGAKIPSYPRVENHQKTTNEELAQLAFAAFLDKPFYSKDKKSSLFNRDYTRDDVIINEFYHQIFFYSTNGNIPSGILFEKNRDEIDEALFIKYLYKLSKNYLKKRYEERIEKSNEKIKNLSPGKDPLSESRIIMYQRNKEINNVCMFYCIALYYQLKKEFDDVINYNKHFDYDLFYRDKNSKYKDEIITYFADNFLSKTIEIISESLDGVSNIGNWIRKAQSQDLFMTKLSKDITIDSKLEETYTNFIKKFKK